jgi:hypothetical protein
MIRGLDRFGVQGGHYTLPPWGRFRALVGLTPRRSESARYRSVGRLPCRPPSTAGQRGFSRSADSGDHGRSTRPTSDGRWNRPYALVVVLLDLIEPLDSRQAGCALTELVDRLSGGL